MTNDNAASVATRTAGLKLLNAGDFAGAKTTLTTLVEAGKADTLTWLGIAAANRGLKDVPAMVSAADRVLALEPRNLQALLLKGHGLMETSDVKAALAFYQAAITLASAQERIPPQLHLDLNMAKDTCHRYVNLLDQHIRRQVESVQSAQGHTSARFARSIDLLSGKSHIFHQQPRQYYFPELPHIQFFERSSFPWLEVLEARTAEIRQEVELLLSDRQAFAPYVQDELGRRPRGEHHGMLNNPDWGAFYLYKDGNLVHENASRCPVTMKALEGVPFSQASKRMPSVLFSLLRPSAKIPPHTGMINARLICHLPLIVPDGCGLRVGSEVREWKIGTTLIFDDTIEHEAWNSSDQVRVVLLFDIWRPELTLEERTLVSTLLEAMDSFESPPGKWGM